MTKILSIFQAMVLLALVLLKLPMLVSEREFLQAAYPLLPFITFRMAYLVATIVEITICLTLMVPKRFLLSQIAMLGCGIVFAANRVALLSGKVEYPCACLGTLPDTFGMSGKTVNRIMWGLIVWFIVTSIAQLIYLRFKRRCFHRRN